MERFSGDTKGQQTHRGSYSSLGNLKEAIYQYLSPRNAEPKPFFWNRFAEDLLTRKAATGTPLVESVGASSKRQTQNDNADGNATYMLIRGIARPRRF